MHAQSKRPRAVPRSRTRSEQENLVKGSHEQALIICGKAMREHEHSTPTSIQKLANASSLAPHPVVRSLLRSLSHWAKHNMASPAEQAVLKYGRAFTGIARAKGYRFRAIKKCFVNAGDLALGGSGTYVEGFAISPSVGIPVHHAWLTLDGTDAVDVTWRTPASECHYFGISFSNEVLEKFIRRTKCWGPLLWDDEVEQVLRDADLPPLTNVIRPRSSIAP
jgi:hypothetical protein